MTNIFQKCTGQLGKSQKVVRYARRITYVCQITFPRVEHVNSAVLDDVCGEEAMSLLMRETIVSFALPITPYIIMPK